jgi:hypothetical protein
VDGGFDCLALRSLFPVGYQPITQSLNSFPLSNFHSIHPVSKPCADGDENCSSGPRYFINTYA